MPEGPGQGFAFRLAREGKPIVGLRNGDVPVWDQNSQQWIVSQPGATGSPPAIGPAGTFYISDGVVGFWGNNLTSGAFITETGYIGLGAVRATAGHIRCERGTILFFRNYLNTIDRRGISFGSAINDTIFYGTVATAAHGYMSTGVDGQNWLGFNANNQISWGEANFTFSRANFQVAFSQGGYIGASAAAVLGFPNSANANMSIWGNGTENYQGGEHVVLWGTVVTPPAANPAANTSFEYQNAAGRIIRGSAGTITIVAPP